MLEFYFKIRLVKIGLKQILTESSLDIYLYDAECICCWFHEETS